jgi:ribonuclease PH
MRAVVDLEKLGERTVTLDCDVLQADGGTRTASITGGFLALALAIRHLEAKGEIQAGVLQDFVAATSVGIVQGRACLDLDYEEDSGAEVDMNIVMTGNGRFVEIQGTAEQTPFDDSEMEALIRLAKRGIQDLVRLQRGLLKKSVAKP